MTPIAQLKQAAVNLALFGKHGSSDNCWCDWSEDWDEEEEGEPFNYDNEDHHSAACREMRAAMRRTE